MTPLHLSATISDLAAEPGGIGLSGVYGIFNRKGTPVEQSSLNTMHEVFGRWFDDDHGAWCEGTVGLGHTMLWNTPESKLEIFPVVDDSTGHRLVLTADVRLDNRSELAEKLGLTAPLAAISDSRLLLAAYLRWGQDSPQYLLGDFAYVIWDEQRQQLFCARDHIGIKQLYYVLSDESFVFANDVGALVASNLVPKDLNEEAVAVYLQSSRYIHPRNTFYRSIQKLEAASTLLISEQDVIRDTYWKAEDSPPIRFDDFEGYVHHLRQLFEDAVRVRLRTAHPVTSHLSGGLDSSAITVLAARMLARVGQPLRVFNWAYMPAAEDDPECSEWSFANKVAARENISLEHIAITPEFIKETYLGADISLYEDNLYWEETQERALSVENGARTILSGWGGDELISYGSHSYYSALIRRGKLLSAFKLMYSNGRQANVTLVRVLKKYIRSTLYAFFSKQMNGPYKIDKDADVFNILKPGFAAVVKSAQPPALQFQHGPHGEQLELFNHGHLLDRIESWAASARRDAIEYRYPLLDKRIVEFALGIPEEIFQPRNGYSRFLFRSAVADILPREVAWAPKYSSPKHFEMRKRLWLAVSKLLLQQDKDLFEHDGEFVDAEALHDIIERIVAQDSTDFDNVENIGVVGPAIAIAVLNRGRQ